MNTVTSIRVRPESAKYTFSSAKRNTSMRSNMKEDSKLMHTQVSNSRPLNSMTKIQTSEFKRLLPKRTDISPERLLEENLALKKTINDLKNSMRLQKAKGETAERKNAKLKKKLDIQFQKEFYWGQKGDYLVMGVKNQYDKIKKSYEDKCKENQEIRRDLKYTQIQEIRAELQEYKSQASRLKDQLDKFVEIYRMPYEIKGEDEVSSKLLIEELKDTIQKLHYDISTYKSGIKSINKLVKERDEKIQFLEKLVIEKDNYSYQIEQTSRRLKHQNQNLKTKNKQLKLQMEDEKQAINQRIQDIKNTEEKRLEKQISIFESQIHVKNQKITKLQAEIVYLSTLLAQWRPSENDSMRNSMDLRVHQQVRPVTMQKKESNVALSIHQAQDLNQSHEINELSKSSLEPSHMVQSSANKKQKSNHYTLKRDKVKKQQIENICLQIKFRLLNKKINFESARKYIQAPEGDQITIKDLLQIFSLQPFCVESPERRILLARYLIEDIEDYTVYYDQERSAPAVIVRSIFEQIIPKFTIPSEGEQSSIRAKVIEMLSKYNVTLNQVVSQHSRQFVLNQKKFIELLDQQELNMGQEYNDFMISHMLKSSPDITQLNFKALMTLLPYKDN